MVLDLWHKQNYYLLKGFNASESAGKASSRIYSYIQIDGIILHTYTYDFSIIFSKYTDN